jgi:hypothetical protein
MLPSGGSFVSLVSPNGCGSAQNSEEQEEMQVWKTPFTKPLCTLNDHFAKTGSGLSRRKRLF